MVVSEEARKTISKIGDMEKKDRENAKKRLRKDSAYCSKEIFIKSRPLEKSTRVRMNSNISNAVSILGTKLILDVNPSTSLSM